MPILTDFNGPNSGLANPATGRSFWFELDTDGELPPYELDTGVELDGFQLIKMVDPNTSEITYRFMPNNIVVRIMNDVSGYTLHIVDNSQVPPSLLEADITEGQAYSIVEAFDDIPPPPPNAPPANAVGGRRKQHKTQKRRKQKSRTSRKNRKSQRLKQLNKYLIKSV